jgi:hypothetical protein
MRTGFNWIVTSVVALSCWASAPAAAQRTGQSVSVQYGKVTGGHQVDLASGAVPSGALVGGTLGLLSASGKSSGKKARNAVIGLAAGGTVAASAQGSTKGILYDIDLGGQGKIQVVSDQHEIRTGDCVAVEKAGDTANVRRVSEGYCDSGNGAAVTAVAASAATDAEECLQAKQQLVDASSADAVELSRKKVELLCND